MLRLDMRHFIGENNEMYINVLTFVYPDPLKRNEYKRKKRKGKKHELQ